MPEFELPPVYVLYFHGYVEMGEKISHSFNSITYCYLVSYRTHKNLNCCDQGSNDTADTLVTPITILYQGSLMVGRHPSPKKVKKLTKQLYEKELLRLQTELVKLQEWVKAEGKKVAVVFEGRDAAGKGGVIKRITQHLNPRICHIIALGTPTEREKSQWYFQRYAAQLPSAGEIMLFDRSWYNRAGVERVMGFCSDEEYHTFLKDCPIFEQMLIDSGIILRKYWFSVSLKEQERRFQSRLNEPTKRWKLSPMDLKARDRWTEYSKAKDAMFTHTDTKESPWYVINSNNKKRARLNCIRHLLDSIPYQDLTPKKMKLPKRNIDSGYQRPAIEKQNIVDLGY